MLLPILIIMMLPYHDIRVAEAEVGVLLLEVLAGRGVVVVVMVRVQGLILILQVAFRTPILYMQLNINVPRRLRRLRHTLSHSGQGGGRILYKGYYGGLNVATQLHRQQILNILLVFIHAGRDVNCFAILQVSILLLHQLYQFGHDLPRSVLQL